jgi:AraC-like DNA-binding protein
MPIISLTIVFTLVILLSFSLHSLVSKRGAKYLNYLLGLFLFARFGQLTIFLLIDNELIIYAPILLKLFCPLYYAAPSFIYLYTVGIVNNRKRLRKIDYLHFLPGLIAIIDNLPWYFSPSINWNDIAQQLIISKNIIVVSETGFFPTEVYLYFRPLVLTVYLLLSFWVLVNSRLFKQKDVAKTKRSWILAGLLTISIFHILNIATVYFRNTGLFFDDRYDIYIWIFGIGIVLFLIILILLMHNPKILYGYILVSAGDKNKIIAVKEAKLGINLADPKNDTENQFIQSIQNYMVHEKPFLNSSFCVMDLANSFKIPIHKCSALINNYIGKNFRDWINQYRIEYFIESYPSKSEKFTIDTIALESGFSSMTTFYRAFKKETGKMPLEYFQTELRLVGNYLH